MTVAATGGVALFIPTFGDGGVERNFVYLANGLAAAGCPVTLISCCEHGAFLDLLASSVRHVVMRDDGDASLIEQLAHLVDKDRPEIIMTGQQRDDAIAVAARRRIASNARLFLNVGTPLSEQSRASHRFFVTRWLHRQRLRALFDGCDGIVANSHGVARDLTAFLGIAASRIAVAPNPAVAPDLDRLATQTVDHAWLRDATIPIIMGAGRLGRVKDFPTLLRAFAILRRERPCRLMILGRGRQSAKLRRLAERLGVAADVELTGFVENPYAYLARAAVFVVSSLREGGPNVLIEAMACGTPVVATDCPHGPREILDGGRHGALVPVGEPEPMARAIAATLTAPADRDQLKRASAPYTVAASAQAYLRAFGLVQEGSRPA
ncbi:MAG: glycosyltransferase [Methylotetracoccus sp.]